MRLLFARCSLSFVLCMEATPLIFFPKFNTFTNGKYSIGDYRRQDVRTGKSNVHYKLFNMENFYDENHQGLKKSGADQGETRKPGTLQGFFLAKHLLDFLPTEKDKQKEKDKNHICVGIRFYNAGGRPQAERRLIAVGVNFRGEEFSRSTNRSYLASATAQLPVENMQKDGATHAVWQAKAARTKKVDKQRITFASYFSNEMIKTLLQPKAGQTIDGISFYIVPWNPGEKDSGYTHLGVSSRLVKGKVKPVESGPDDSPSHIVSDQSCPEYCIAPAIILDVPANARNSADTYILATQPIIPNDRYLNVWD